ncbi:MAG TPA: GNAT family N-acetyltransferase [Allosphingosinicella sp.]|nr:GNAT family N-acetyltransferase [Allosphingosinicella sp.]
MIEGWVTALDWAPELHAAAASLAARRSAEPAAPAPAPAPLSFARFCEDEARLRGWRRLETAASLPMQGHAFAAALATTLLADAHVEIFFVPESGSVEALLPLCRGAGPFGRWRMIGARHVFEPGDALCRTPQAAGPLAEAIVRSGRAVELERIPADSPLIPALGAALRGRGWMSVRPWTPAPTIKLDESWKDPASRFNPGRRSDLRRAARRASEFGEVSYEMLSPGPAEFDALFDEAIDVEERSWKRESGTAIASCRAKERFFRDLFRSAAEQGLFRIAFMRIDGRIVAMQMALEWQGRYWLFKIGFDEQFGRCSPGTLLMLHTIGWAAQRQLTAFELLGNVEPWIAQFWTREQHDCVCLRAYPFNARGAVALAADAIVWLRARLARAGA